MCICFLIVSVAHQQKKRVLSLQILYSRSSLINVLEEDMIQYLASVLAHNNMAEIILRIAGSADIHELLKSSCLDLGSDPFGIL